MSSSANADVLPGEVEIEVADDGALPVEEGQELTARVQLVWSPEGISEIRYQWQSSKDGKTWLSIPGADKERFTPRQSETGFSLRVMLTYMLLDSAYSEIKAYSSATPPVGHATDDHAAQVQDDHLTNLNGASGDDVSSGGPGADSIGDALPTDVHHSAHHDDATVDLLSEGRISHVANDSVPLNILLDSGGGDFVWANVDSHLAGSIQEGLVIHGTAGDDTIYGSSGNDFIYGEAGNDHIYGGAGNDHIEGDDGNDVLHGGAGNDHVYGGDGNDVVSGGDGNDTADGGDGNDIVSGGAGNDAVYGGDGNDAVFGGSGNDAVHGGSGNDLVSGGAGDDKVYGGEGNDHVFGGDGNDAVYGGSGNDLVSGGAGDDKVYGGEGNDHVFGGDGNDAVYGGSGNDLVSGGAGDDKVYGGEGNDHVLGGDGNDTVSGGDGNDYVSGGAGDDQVSGGAGDDVLYGGDGHNVFIYHYGDGHDQIMDFVEGDDHIEIDGEDQGSGHSYTVELAEYGKDYYFTDGGRLAVYNSSGHDSGSGDSNDDDSNSVSSGSSDGSDQSSGSGDGSSQDVGVTYAISDLSGGNSSSSNGDGLSGGSGDSSSDGASGSSDDGGSAYNAIPAYQTTGSSDAVSDYFAYPAVGSADSNGSSVQIGSVETSGSSGGSSSSGDSGGDGYLYQAGFDGSSILEINTSQTTSGSSGSSGSSGGSGGHDDSGDHSGSGGSGHGSALNFAYDDGEFDYSDFGKNAVYEGGLSAEADHEWTAMLDQGVVDPIVVDPHPIEYGSLSDWYDSPGVMTLLDVSHIAITYDDHGGFFL